jgi:hypothetical protein
VTINNNDPAYHYDNTAGWGIVTQPTQSGAAQHGTKAMWCGGTNLASWPYYPAGNDAGIFAVYLPNTQNFYTDTLSYYYTYPSVPPIASGYPFVGSTFFAGASPDLWFGANTNVDFQPPITGSWSQFIHHPGAAGDMPATEGWLRFRFLDWGLGGGQGKGATVDNIQLTGWEYGPVRNPDSPTQPGVKAVRAATSGVTSTTVDVTWLKPYAAQGGTTVDSRTLTYHVWRYDVLAGTYTEIGSGTTGLSAQDTAAPSTRLLEYAVQAVDPSDTSSGHWGQLQYSANVALGDGVTITNGSIHGTVTNSDQVALPGVSVTVDGVAKTPTDANGAYTVPNLTAGSHSVVLSLAGYNSQSFTATVANGQTNNLQNVVLTAASSYTSVIRFYNLKIHCHLLTADPNEIASLRNNSTYRYEGQALYVNNSTNPTEVYRFYNKVGGFYLYTADPAERDHIIATAPNWQYQNVAFHVTLGPGAPVWRIQNKTGHFYMWSMDPNEVAHIASTWTVEGVAFRIAP